MQGNDYNSGMTESTSSPQPSVQATAAAPAPAAEYSSRGQRKAAGTSWSVTLMIVFLVVALVVGGGAWFSQKRFDAVGREVASQVQSMTAQLIDTKREAKQALALAADDTPVFRNIYLLTMNLLRCTVFFYLFI